MAQNSYTFDLLDIRSYFDRYAMRDTPLYRVEATEEEWRIRRRKVINEIMRELVRRSLQGEADQWIRHRFRDAFEIRISGNEGILDLNQEPDRSADTNETRAPVNGGDKA